MHGLIHIILKELVVTKFGEDKWAAIGAKLGLTEGDATILEMKQYPDETTVAGVVATAEVLGVSVDDALRVYGAFFVQFVHMGGHLRMLKSMGDTLEAFLGNINHLHFTLERTFRTANFPIFELKVLSGSNGSANSVLSYSSLRGELLAPLVEGVLPELAKCLHKQSVTMVRHDSPGEGFNTTWTLTTAPLPDEQNPTVEAATTDAETLEKGGAWHSALCCTNSSSSAVVVPADAPAEEASATTTKKTKAPEKTVDLEDMVTGLDEETVAMLDALHQRAQDSGDPATVLMRGVPAGKVCAEWSDAECLDATSNFWSTNRGKFTDYAKSRNVARATRFVTHSWSPPDDWAEYMGQNCSYGDVKTTELATVSRDLGENLGVDDWKEEITYWIDKTCIPQQHSLLMVCVNLIEEFLQKCDGMVVLLSWQYFERLWCVYEWAAFLICHDASNVTICVDAFLRPSTRHLYIKSVENFSVANSKCNNEGDRPVLAAKVAEYYNSTEAFEHFARSTAIGVVALAVAHKASRGTYLEDFMPWVELAERLKLNDLAAALRTCDPLTWRREAMGDTTATTLGAQARGWQSVFKARLDQWFQDVVKPVLDQSRLAAVRPEHHGLIGRVSAASAAAAVEPTAPVPAEVETSA